MRKSKKRFNNTPIAEIRQSQLLTTYGPGAMVDLPEQSVVISGLTYWKGDRQYIREDRLRNKICDILKKTDSNITDIKLFKPPHETNEFNAAPSGVKAFIFPMWFVRQVEQTIRLDGKDYRTRPLVNYRAVQEEKLKAVPVRFVQACVNGHLSDIDWYAYAHNDFKTKCRKQLWLDEGGSGNDFEEIFVRCECGQRRPLSKAKTPNSKVLGICQGHRPWLASNGKEECWACAIDNSGNIVQTDKPEYNRLLCHSRTHIC